MIQAAAAGCDFASEWCDAVEQTGLRDLEARLLRAFITEARTRGEARRSDE